MSEVDPTNHPPPPPKKRKPPVRTSKTFQLDPSIPPWERQPGESGAAWEAFVHYRDQGPTRKIVKTFEHFNHSRKSRNMYEEWGRGYFWKYRAECYDRHLDRLEIEAREKAIKDMAERHAQISVAMQDKVVQRLNDFDPKKLTAEGVARWIETSVKIERLSRGVPTDSVKTESKETKEVTLDLSHLTDEELAVLEKIGSKQAGNAGAGQAPTE